MQDLPLGGNRIEEFVEFVCQVAVLEVSTRTKAEEQPKPDQIIVPTGIHVGQVREWARPGQFITSTRFDNQVEVQEGPNWATTPTTLELRLGDDWARLG